MGDRYDARHAFNSNGSNNISLSYPGEAEQTEQTAQDYFNRLARNSGFGSSVQFRAAIDLEKKKAKKSKKSSKILKRYAFG